MRSPILQSHGWMLGLTFAVSAICLAARVQSAWIPLDEGLLGQTAERALHGELPHRDFDDPYTGGLTYLHAALFWMFGVNLLWLRLLLLFFSLLLVPVIYSIAARAAPPLLAAAVTLLCTVWSVPNYFAAMPSWYNLFFAVFGCWFLLRFVDSKRSSWLLWAGAMGGLSFLTKSVGAYYVAAVFLFLIYHEQTTARPKEALGWGRSYSVFVTVGLLCFAAAIFVLILGRLTLMDAVHFLLPELCLAGLLIRNEWSIGRSGSIERWRDLSRWGLVFVAGVALPVGAWLIFYAFQGSLHDLYVGLFVVPQRRLESVSMALPSPFSLVTCIPIASLLLWPLAWKTANGNTTVVAGAALICGGATFFGANQLVYDVIWGAVRPLVPIAAIAGCLLLLRRSEPGTASQEQALFLVLAMASLVSLVQFPFSFGTYFCYCAPLVILAILFVVQMQPNAPRRILACILGLYLGFAALWMNTSDLRSIGAFYWPLDTGTPLDEQRSPLNVDVSSGTSHNAVIAELRQRCPEGSWIYATADCPQIYFLSHTRNPTRTFFECFDADFGSDARTARLLQMLNERDIKVVVLNWFPRFSGTPPQAFVDEVAKRYPHRQHFGYDPDRPEFTVFWKE